MSAEPADPRITAATEAIAKRCNEKGVNSQSLAEVALAAADAVITPPDDEIGDLVQAVRRMVEDGHPCGSAAGDDWFRIMCDHLRQVEAAFENARAAVVSPPPLDAPSETTK